METKVGIFFTIDALIGGALLLVGILVASHLYVSEVPQPQIVSQAYDVGILVAKLKNRELRDLNSISLMQNGTINDLDRTVAEQMAVFYTEGDMATLQNFADNALQSYFPTGSDYAISIDDDTILIHNQTNASFRSVMRQPIFYVDGSLPASPELAGPYMLEVQVWK